MQGACLAQDARAARRFTGAGVKERKIAAREERAPYQVGTGV
jgi:hypothetical protein